MISPTADEEQAHHFTRTYHTLIVHLTFAVGNGACDLGASRLGVARPPFSCPHLVMVQYLRVRHSYIVEMSVRHCSAMCW
jgi:hypothetical protein